MDGLEKKRRMSQWVVPAGCHPIQRFPFHVVRFLCRVYCDFSLYDASKNNTPHNSSGIWRSRLDLADICALMASECQAHRIYAQSSRMKHKTAGIGLFSGKMFCL